MDGTGPASDLGNQEELFSVLKSHVDPSDIHPRSLTDIQAYIDAVQVTYEVAPCTMTHLHTPACTLNVLKVFGRTAYVLGPLYVALNGASVVWRLVDGKGRSR